jgi:acetyl esterase
VKSFSQTATITPVIAPDAIAVMEELAARVPPWPDDPGVHDRRVALEAVFGLLPREPVADVQDLVIPTPDGRVRARRYANPSAEGLLVFFHGGAWVAGSIESHDGICRALANASGSVVLNVGYRLAPEHPFPAGLSDAETAIRWAVEHRERLGAGGGGVAIAGDSAGATFCAVAALSLRGGVSERLALQVLVYPATDVRMGSETWRTMGEGYLLTRGEVEWSLEQYGPPDRTDWRVSPLLAADVSGVPPALIITAECDPLRAEAESYANRLVDAGVCVTTHRYLGMVHGFVGLAGLRASELALDEIASEVRRAVVKAGC